MIVGIQKYTNISTTHLHFQFTVTFTEDTTAFAVKNTIVGCSCRVRECLRLYIFMYMFLCPKINIIYTLRYTADVYDAIDA